MSAQLAWAQLGELNNRLVAERRLLEYLLFKLTELELVLATDSSSFMPSAVGEIEHIIDLIRGAELGRAVAVSGVAEALGISHDDVSLKFLATHSPKPLRTVFADHDDDLRSLAGQISHATQRNRRLVWGALEVARDDLVRTGDSRPATRKPSGAEARLRDVGYRRALGILDDLSQSSLDDWLRAG